MDNHLYIIVGIQLVKGCILSRCVGCGVDYVIELFGNSLMIINCRSTFSNLCYS